MCLFILLLSYKWSLKKQQKHKRRYTWGINDRLQKTDDSKQGITKYGYSPTGHLELAHFQDGTEQVRDQDNVGNLFETTNHNDREYSKGGRLEKKGSWNYKYDADGFLTEKYKTTGRLFKTKKDHWQYVWNAAGMLQTVIRPDKEQVHFTYDALGRRLSKTFKNTTTKWLWDGNVPLHEWKENQNGDILSNSTVGDNGIVTWVFEENSFIPTAKLKNNKKFSILADHLGTPTSMHNAQGEQVWERSLDTFGKVKHGDNNSCPFMYQGQYYDAEIDLAYNRFRYYDPEDGRYISVDPIGLLSEEFGFYNYVENPNLEIDDTGLASREYKNAWGRARRKYWKDQVKANPNKFSQRNKDRIKKGLSPQIRAKVRNNKTGRITNKNISMELEHTHLKQRGGSLKAHESWNLTEATPWGHSSMDSHRHTGNTLVKITKGVHSF